MLREILEHYLNVVSNKVDFKYEKEIAERHLNYIKEKEKLELQKSN